MKNAIHHFLKTGLILIFFAGSVITYAQTINDSFITIKGVVRDSKTNDNIIYATVSVPGTGVGTVTNSEGEFTLKVAKTLNAEYFEISHLSYATTKFKVAESLGKEKEFLMEPQMLLLKETSVYPKDARSIVENALNSIRKNYSDVPNMMTGFYRETIKQRRDYLSISEAVIDIYKAAYTSGQDDQVKIYKGRKGAEVKKADTLMVQLQGGPNVSMLLDIVKNTDLSIALDNLENYKFEFLSMVKIDDKLNYVIGFTPNVTKDDPLYNGKLYISQTSLAITRAEFSLDLTNQDKAASMFVRKKPVGLVFMPTMTNYLVTYKEQNGKNYLNYVRVELKFRCDWKKKWFKNYYTILSEVAITDRREDNILRFANQEIFKSHMIFSDKVQNFTDPDFWGEYNIIEPDESIENAIKKISKNWKK